MGRRRRKRYGGQVWGEVPSGAHVTRSECRDHAFGRWMPSGSGDRYYRVCRSCDRREYISRTRYVEMLTKIVEARGGSLYGVLGSTSQPARVNGASAVAPRRRTRQPWERDDAGERAGAPREATWNAPQRRGSAGGWYQAMESRRREMRR
jgi:hypothetical protein